MPQLLGFKYYANLKKGLQVQQKLFNQVDISGTFADKLGTFTGGKSLEIQNELKGEAAEKLSVELLARYSFMSANALISAKESSLMLKYTNRALGFDLAGKTGLAEKYMEIALYYFQETISKPSVVHIRAILSLALLKIRLNQFQQGALFYVYAVSMAKLVGINREASLNVLCNTDFEKEECRKLWWHIYSLDQWMKYRGKSVLHDEDNRVFLPDSNSDRSSSLSYPQLGMVILSSTDWFTPPLENQSISANRILLTRMLSKSLRFNQLYYGKKNKINVYYIHSVLDGSLQLWWNNISPKFAPHLLPLYSGKQDFAIESWKVYELCILYNYLKADVLVPFLINHILERETTIQPFYQLAIIASENAHLLNLMLNANAKAVYSNSSFAVPIFHLTFIIYCASLATLPDGLKSELQQSLTVHLGCVLEFSKASQAKHLISNKIEYLISITDVKQLIKAFIEHKYFAQVDHALILLYGLTSFCYAMVIPIQLIAVGFTKGAALSKCWTNMETAMILNVAFQLIRIGFHVNYYDIVYYMQTNIALELVYYLIGGVSISIFVFSIIDVADASHLYDKIKIGEKIVDCGKLLKVVRLLGMIVFIAFTSLWATKGLHTDYETYNFYRRCFYSGFGILSMFLSFPVVLFFGNKIINTMLQVEYSKTHSSREIDAANKSEFKSEKTHTGNSIQNQQKDTKSAEQKTRRTSLSKSFRETVKMKKINDAISFKLLIRAIAFWLYFMLGLTMAVIIIVHETTHDHLALLITKCLTELYIWSSSGFAALYFFRRAMNARVKL
ncbi:hypothetical protein HDV01_002342 [Terramyces sp. JEL0728]|nr:hypothetical protein HDV01_002342 [Terramyces sp. JEL0728]